MAANRTFAQMRSQALRYADLDGFPSVVEAADPFLNARLKELYDMLILCRGEDYYATEATATSVADQALYTFASDFGVTDFYRLITVRADNGTEYHDLDAFESLDLPDLLEVESNGGVWHPANFRRRLRPTGVEIRPAPDSTSYTFTLVYIPAFTDLSADGDTFDGVNGWERWAELGAAIDLREKEEADATGLKDRQALIGQRIMALAGTRDMGRPARRRLTRPSRRRPRRGTEW